VGDGGGGVVAGRARAVGGARHEDKVQGARRQVPGSGGGRLSEFLCCGLADA
jgi:hypothetical protein